MRLKYLDLMAAAAITLFTLAATYLGMAAGATGFRIWYWPFGILMVLFIPGYALALAILPDLDRATTVLLSLGISISMDILGGLVLHYTPWGLQPMSWAVWLSCISLPSCMVAAYHRSLIAVPVAVRTPALKSDNKVIYSFVLTGILLIAAFILGRHYAFQSGNNFTQFWALPAVNQDGYVVHIGIHNQELETTVYSLVVDSRGRTIEQWNNIKIFPGESWTVSLPLMEKPVDPFTFLLFRTGSSDEVYRMVHLVPASFEKNLAP